MNNTIFKSLFSDPAAYREQLVIPAVRGPARLGDVMAAFQRQDFARIDPSLIALANGRKPEPGRFWWERTKGASKDSDAAIMLLWLLGFSRRPLACQVGAADQDQANELKKAAKDILRLNDWLADLVDRPPPSRRGFFYCALGPAHFHLAQPLSFVLSWLP